MAVWLLTWVLNQCSSFFLSERAHKLANFLFRYTQIPQEVLDDYIGELSQVFTQEAYNLLTNNCNNFSNELSLFLTGSPIPVSPLSLRLTAHVPVQSLLQEGSAFKVPSCSSFQLLYIIFAGHQVFSAVNQSVSALQSELCFLSLQEHITRLPNEVLSTPFGQMLAPMLGGGIILDQILSCALYPAYVTSEICRRAFHARSTHVSYRPYAY